MKLFGQVGWSDHWKYWDHREVWRKHSDLASETSFHYRFKGCCKARGVSSLELRMDQPV